MNFFTKIINFLGCLLHENCEYSIKKILIYIFSILVIYLAIFTDKNFYEILIFIGALLGIRGYERVQLSNLPDNLQSNPGDAPSLEDSTLGSTNYKKPSRRLLTD